VQWSWEVVVVLRNAPPYRAEFVPIQYEIIYRDLKAENVLIDSDRDVKVINLELAQDINRSGVSTFCGS
jgi:serine/threonine protein kinase